VSFTRFFKRAGWDDERARELEAYLQIETDENIARGMSPANARLAARRKLGNVTAIREDIYRFNTIAFLDTAWRDVRYGLRLLRLNPSFALVAVLSLALGIGANTAIFQLLNALRIRTLPVERPEQLAEVRVAGEDNRTGSFTGEHSMLTNPLWEAIRDRQEAFSDIFAWGSTGFEMSQGGESRRAEGVWVSGAFFTTLGVRPVVGRLITTVDDRRGCPAPPAVISYGFWQREYGGSPSVVGRTVTLDGHTYDIAGVTPQNFLGVEVGRAFDVAIPICAVPFGGNARNALDRRDGWFLGAIGRLKPGWSFEKATAHLTTLSPPIFADTLPTYRPEDAKDYLSFTLGAFPAGTGVSNLRRTYESPLWLLLGTTALVLLIACANLANLMLARATTREREIAVRLALGASRMRIVRQFLAESLLIAGAGALAGALLASWLSDVLVAALTTAGDPVVVDIANDWNVFAFIALLAATACLIFGLLPAMRATAASPGAAMKAGSRGSTDSRERFGLRRALVIAQVALSLVLVVGALLFVRSYRNQIAVDAGFSRDQLLTARLDFRRAGLSAEQLRLVYRQLLDRLRAQPGVDDAAQVRNVPVAGLFSNRTIVIDGVPRKESVNFNSISERYFSTVNNALLAGRDFERRDTLATARVAIVTESFARVFFGGQNPIGRRFKIDEPPDRPRPEWEIVGLARDSKYTDLREAFEPLMFVPAAQDDQLVGAHRLLIRSRQPLSTVSAIVAAQVRDVNPTIVLNFRSMQTIVNDSMLRERLMAALSGSFGVLAAVIAMIGLYGVMSYSVARRRNEIGIRMALGADRSDVVRMVMREAGRLIVVGLVVGVVVSLATTRFAAALLYGLQAHDPATLLMATVALTLVGIVASYVPAWRASRLEPIVALREE